MERKHAGEVERHHDNQPEDEGRLNDRIEVERNELCGDAEIPRSSPLIAEGEGITEYRQTRHCDL